MKNCIYMLAPEAGIQMGAYIICSDDGEAVVIDGGWQSDAQNLLSYLREATGMDIPRISAWILTHPHPDHVEGFLEIMKNHRDRISLEGPILYNFPSVQYLERLDRDAAECAGNFYRALPSFADKACIVTGGDSYTFGRMRFDFLCSPDYALKNDVCNNSSLVIKLTHGDRTVMLCADCGYDLGKKLLSQYGGSGILKCDICQMAHHGQGGCDRDFYEAVSPSVCLWPTPAYLWNNDAGLGYNTHEWKTLDTRAWMEQIGVRENLVSMNGTQIYELY